MARTPNIIEPGSVYHLIWRFVAREWFIQTHEERITYLLELGTQIRRTSWRCFSYAIMSNHVHLGVLAGEEPVASWARAAHTNFALWMNGRHQRIGAVFVRGPNVIKLEPERIAPSIAYIHCNPVRAGLVSDPAHSDWTSHRKYLGLTSLPSWVDVGLGLELAGAQSATDLRNWFETGREAVVRGRPRKDLRRVGVASGCGA